VAIGAMMENIGVGIAIGAGLGAAIGTFAVERGGKVERDEKQDRTPDKARR
jgi:hypothetical protein